MWEVPILFYFTWKWVLPVWDLSNIHLLAVTNGSVWNTVPSIVVDVHPQIVSAFIYGSLQFSLIQPTISGANSRDHMVNWPQKINNIAKKIELPIQGKSARASWWNVDVTAVSFSHRSPGFRRVHVCVCSTANVPGSIGLL